MERRRIATVVLIVLVLVGGAALVSQRLGDDDEGAGADGGAGGVTTTPKALAALVVEVLDVEPDGYDHEPVGQPDGVGVQVRLGADGEYDGDLVALAVWKADAVSTCDGFDGCEEWKADGGTYRLGWDEVEPEEDPGLYVLEFLADGVLRSGAYAGATIEGDPRDLDLPVDVARMQALLSDDRLDLTAPEELDDVDLPRWPDQVDETETSEPGGNVTPQDLLSTPVE